MAFNGRHRYNKDDANENMCRVSAEHYNCGKLTKEQECEILRVGPMLNRWIEKLYQLCQLEYKPHETEDTRADPNYRLMAALALLSTNVVYGANRPDLHNRVLESIEMIQVLEEKGFGDALFWRLEVAHGRATQGMPSDCLHFDYNLRFHSIIWSEPGTHPSRWDHKGFLHTPPLNAESWHHIPAIARKRLRQERRRLARKQADHRQFAADYEQNRIPENQRRTDYADILVAQGTVRRWREDDEHIVVLPNPDDPVDPLAEPLQPMDSLEALEPFHPCEQVAKYDSELHNNGRANWRLDALMDIERFRSRVSPECWNALANGLSESDQSDHNIDEDDDHDSDGSSYNFKFTGIESKDLSGISSDDPSESPSGVAVDEVTKIKKSPVNPEDSHFSATGIQVEHAGLAETKNRSLYEPNLHRAIPHRPTQPSPRQFQSKSAAFRRPAVQQPIHPQPNCQQPAIHRQATQQPAVQETGLFEPVHQQQARELSYPEEAGLIQQGGAVFAQHQADHEDHYLLLPIAISPQPIRPQPNACQVLTQYTAWYQSTGRQAYWGNYAANASPDRHEPAVGVPDTLGGCLLGTSLLGEINDSSRQQPNPLDTIQQRTVLRPPGLIRPPTYISPTPRPVPGTPRHLAYQIYSPVRLFWDEPAVEIPDDVGRRLLGTSLFDLAACPSQ
jgi:hypothetical protein